MVIVFYRDVMEPAKICIRLNVDADLSPDQNLLLPAIIVTTI